MANSMPKKVEEAVVRKSVRVQAPIERAFSVFVEQMEAWWPATHHIGKTPFEAIFVEPRVGGRWYAVAEDGSSGQTGYVIEWQPPQKLVLAWQLGADWQFDPALVTEVEVQFIAESAQITRVELQHRNLQRMGERAAQVRGMVDAPGGWTAILDAFSRVVSNSK